MAEPRPEDVVDAINDIAGVHPGRRAAHAKGTLCAGTFTATPAAARITRAAHMQGEPVRATVRFSNGGGDPGAPDYATEGRGMAVKLYLDDGTRTDMVALRCPSSSPARPRTSSSSRARASPIRRPGQPDIERIGAWLGDASRGRARDPGCGQRAAARQLCGSAPTTASTLSAG